MSSIATPTSITSRLRFPRDVLRDRIFRDRTSEQIFGSSAVFWESRALFREPGRRSATTTLKIAFPRLQIRAKQKCPFSLAP